MNELYKYNSQTKYMWEIVFTILVFDQIVNFLWKETVFKLKLKSIFFEILSKKKRLFNYPSENLKICK